MSARHCVCGHPLAHHDPDDGCGACALAMIGPCREFRPRPRYVVMDAETFAYLLNEERP